MQGKDNWIKKSKKEVKQMLPIQDFVTYLYDNDRAQLTITGYKRDIEQFERWFRQTNGEECTLNNITPTDIRAYRQFLVTVEQIKATTINRRLAALSALMSWAVQTGLVESDPTSQIRTIPHTDSRPKYLDEKAQYSLQRAIEKDLQLSRLRYPKRWRSRKRDAALIIFMMHTGLRLQETLDLRITDLQLGERKGTVLVRRGKGNKQRSIPLNSEARKAIEDWLSVRPENDNNYLWVALEREESGHLSCRTAQHVIRRLGQDAGLIDLTPHMLRHTFAKNLIDSGVSLEKVAALLGHSNLNTTRIYITPSQNDLEQAVEKLSSH